MPVERARASGLADDHHVESAVVERGIGRDAHAATEIPSVGDDDAAHVAFDEDPVDLDCATRERYPQRVVSDAVRNIALPRTPPALSVLRLM